MKAIINMSDLRKIRKLLKSEYVDIFVNKENEVDITFTKDNITIVKSMKCENVNEGSKRLFAKVIDCIDSEEFTVTDNSIKAGRLKFNSLPELNIEEKIEFNLDDKVLEIDNEELQKGLDCSYCIAKDNTREVLRNIYVNGNEFVALDGYRMAIRRINTDTTKEFYIHSNLAKILIKFKKYIGKVKFYLDGDKTIVSIEGIYIISKKESSKDMQYIRYKELIPNEHNNFVVLNKYELKELKDTIKRNMKLITGWEEDKLRLGFIKLKPENSVDALNVKFIHNKIEKTLTCTLKNIEDEFKIGINSKYLLETLSKYDGEIMLKMNSEVSPILIEKDNKTDLILPIRMIR